MFQTFKEMFSSGLIEEDSITNDDDLITAAASLMFAVILADGRIKSVELLALGEILKKHFGVQENSIKEITKLARLSSQREGTLESYARNIREIWGNAKRTQMLEHLWVVALADKQLHLNEDKIIHKIASLLYLTEIQVELACNNAKKKISYDDFA